MIRLSQLRLLAATGIGLAVFGSSLPATAQPGGDEPGTQGPPRGAGPGRAGGGGGFGRGGGLQGGPWDIETETGSVHIDVLTRDVRSPWSLVFLPDGNLLFTEREGRLRIIRDGQLVPTAIEGLPAIDNSSIGGLMGLALHPDFENNDLLYFAYSKANPADGAELALAVARARWGGGASLMDVEDIFVADSNWYSNAISQENDRCCGQGPYNGSYGARIAFGPDGKLYVTVGDRNWGEEAQNTMSYLGKILRLNDDGSVPADNPFVGDGDVLPEIYSLGHRNPTGLRFDSETGELYATEFGPAGGDEVNRIIAGGNYGWILITQGNHYDDAEKVLGSGDVESYIDPIQWWPRGGNPGNLIVYRGDEFPAWDGDILVAVMSGAGLSTGLVRLTLGADGSVTGEERMFAEVGQRFRDVAAGPDGRIYVLTESSPMASAGAVLVLSAAD